MSTENRPLGIGLPFSFPISAAVVLPVCFLLVLFSPKGQLGQAEFVAKAASGGKFEVESSKLANRAAKREDVRQFAQEMIADHEKANKELAVAASEAGHEMPTKMADNHEQLLTMVRDAQVSNFDSIYIATQVSAHEEAVTLFTTASKNLQNQTLKAYATKTLPVIKEHLEQIKQLAMISR